VAALQPFISLHSDLSAV